MLSDHIIMKRICLNLIWLLNKGLINEFIKLLYELVCLIAYKHHLKIIFKINLLIVFVS